VCRVVAGHQGASRGVLAPGGATAAAGQAPSRVDPSAPRRLTSHPLSLRCAVCMCVMSVRVLCAVRVLCRESAPCVRVV